MARGRGRRDRRAVPRHHRDGRSRPVAGPITLRGVAGLQDVLDRAADGGRITPEEALELYTDAPCTRSGGRPTPSGAGDSRQHRDVHHRPQHQLHQRLRHGLQVLRLLPRAEPRRGLDARAGRDPAPLRRGGRPRRHPDHVAGRALAGPRHRVVRADLQRHQGELPDAHAAQPRRVRGRAHRTDVRPRPRHRHRAAARRGPRQLRRRRRRDPRRPAPHRDRSAQGEGRGLARR